MKPRLAGNSPSLQRIVERQLRNWELQAAQQRVTPSRRPFLCDFVAISREVGSGGAVLAQAVGERLGWKVYDRELLDVMSEHEEYRRVLYSTLDERQRNWIDGLLVLCAPETLRVRDDYRKALGRTLLTIAHHESAVFVGRGAHVLLPPDVGVRVRVYSVLEDRVERYAEENGLSADEARRAISKLDRERAAYLKDLCGVDAERLDLYDVAVNLSRLTVAQACDVVEAAVKARRVTVD